MLTGLAKFVEDAYVNLVTGLILLVTAGFETVHTLNDTQIGVHHGVAVFAVMHVLKYLPHIVHGTELVIKGSER